MISSAIKAKREQRGWSKKYLSDLLGVSSAAIGQYEKGDNMPKMEVLLKLNKVFEYDFINDKSVESVGNEQGVNTFLSPSNNPIIKSNAIVTPHNNYQITDNVPPDFYKTLPMDHGIGKAPTKDQATEIPEWYWKIDTMIANQNRTNDLLEKQNELLNKLLIKS